MGGEEIGMRGWKVLVREREQSSVGQESRRHYFSPDPEGGSSQRTMGRRGHLVQALHLADEVTELETKVAPQ